VNLGFDQGIRREGCDQALRAGRPAPLVQLAADANMSRTDVAGAAFNEWAARCNPRIPGLQAVHASIRPGTSSRNSRSTA
jgi:hypothetical protein